jgi:hypothetical protein
MSHDIVLDRDVRDWVLVPLTASIFLMMLIRQYATQARCGPATRWQLSLLSVRGLRHCACTLAGSCGRRVCGCEDFARRPPLVTCGARDTCVRPQALMGGAPTAKAELKEVREKQALMRSQLLRAACGFIPESGFRQRRAYLAAKVCGGGPGPAARCPPQLRRTHTALVSEFSHV